MTWARFDDQFYANEKSLAMSHSAFRLYVVAISYCRSKNDGKGMVTVNAARALCGMHGVARKCCSELEELGCWEPVKGGWLIHDYPEYGPPTSTERVRRHRTMKRDETFHGVSDDVSGNGVGTPPVPVPDPEPVPEPVKKNREENAVVFNNIADVVEMTRRAASREGEAA